jgi:hypothetical protein
MFKANKQMRTLLVLGMVWIYVWACSSTTHGGRTSTNYSITTETVDAGGVNAQSANYSLRGNAMGEFGAGSSGVTTSSTYTAKIAYVGQLSDMLEPITAGSRMTHGGAGTFDIDLPLVGSPGIECRANPNKIVFTFANPLTSIASVSAPAGASGSIDNTDAHRYIVTLPGLPNAQYTTISLSNVQDSDANSRASVQVTMGVLFADVNQDTFVLSGDYTAVRQRSGSSLDGTNFKFDVNADGFILSGDYTSVRGQSGMHLP